MPDIIRVYLITGFLGSGKTTFLNRIIHRFPKDQKLMILMNEFGEIGIDGACIESDELNIMEISKGSIFCVCVKTDFIKSLYEIANTIAPDVLIIESTGVANPSDLKRDLKLPLFKNRFQFMEQFCVIDSRNFMDAYGTYVSLEKQIASSTFFLINKIDQASPEAIEQVKEVISSIHPDPEFYETTYADIPLERFFFPQTLTAESKEIAQGPTLVPEELEKYITRVYLITGFLGSGKTTFLNRIIQRFPGDQKLMILMSKGSICCVCVKTDFIKGLYEIANTIAPDVLIIESTGEANPSDLKQDLKLPLFKNRFQLMEQFCVIDACNFMDAYGTYVSLEKQIASSTFFLINKIDQASPETIEQVKEVISSIHPDPEFYETTYGDIPLERFFFPQTLTAESKEIAQGPTMAPEELEKYLEEILETITAEMTPPDRLMSAAYKWAGDNLAQIGEMARVLQMARGLPSSIIRAKGFLANQGTFYLFSYVMGDWSLRECDIPTDRIPHKNIIVFIGPPESVEALEGITADGNWSKLSTYQPFP